MLKNIRTDLLALVNPQKAEQFQRFFKTGKGDYAEGDVMLGISMPDQRKIAQRYYAQLSLDDLKKLLQSKEHECRLTALLCLVLQYQKAGDTKKQTIVDFYLSMTDHINNWDLVDCSAHKILGHWLLDKKDRHMLYQLAQSKNLWSQRISIVATWMLISYGQLMDTIQLAEILIDHKHDLIHKAVGWMLREVGKKNQSVLESFLRKHHKTMPRTMLRYAIEKLSEAKRKHYMKR